MLKYCHVFPNYYVIEDEERPSCVAVLHFKIKSLFLTQNYSTDSAETVKTLGQKNFPL